MLRRVARVLRVGLLTLGIGLLAWMPFSWHFFWRIDFPWASDEGGIVVDEGSVLLAKVSNHLILEQTEVRVRWGRNRFPSERLLRREVFLPTYLGGDGQHGPATFVTTP